MTTTEVGPRHGAPPPSPSPARTRRELRRGRRWRLGVVPLAIALVCLVGATLLLYPAAASWFSQVEESQRIAALSDDLEDRGLESLRAELDKARRYNQGLTDGGAAVAANERLPLANNAARSGGFDYLSLLPGDTDGVMARLKIPGIQVDLPIYHGTGEHALTQGVGHLEGTALPVGGPSTHSVLTGHRGLATAELFTHLDRVGVDDTFTIEVFGEVLVYRVITTLVVEPEDTESLFAQPGRDLVTLVTCTPLGVNSHRILVTGERVIPTPQEEVDDAGKPPDIPGFPWWAVVAGGVLVVAAVYVWWSGRPARVRPAVRDTPELRESETGS